eukprot:TRINITY_DN12153_c0_g1_i1.p1 TRINITY_DN12153_c0_g1~~TRINITY_DN12153_c0_g1_i1.p1  ORF type:complete len:106 (+),score=21.27 TRINITY_DN12153_c0_g1_i1:133-450(+)
MDLSPKKTILQVFNFSTLPQNLLLVLYQYQKQRRSTNPISGGIYFLKITCTTLFYVIILWELVYLRGGLSLQLNKQTSLQLEACYGSHYLCPSRTTQLSRRRGRL